MLAAGLAAVAPAGAQALCSRPEIGLSVAALRSQWREQDERGRRLVEEDGTLTGLGLRAALQCRPWVFGLQLAQARGQRRYDGVDSRGAPVVSSSRLVHSESTLEALLPAIEPVLLGGRLRVQQIERDIAGVGAALGYPESFRYWQAQVGARSTFALAAGLQLSLDGWIGAGPSGRVAVRLPYADPVTLPLGPSRAAELGLQLLSSAPSPIQGGAGWGWRMGLQWTLQDIGAGSARPLMRNGAVVGGAAQPAIRQQSWAISLGIVGWF
jgi:hypothetical protein